MIFDTVPYAPVTDETEVPGGFKAKHTRNFLLFLERLLRVRIVISAREVFLGRSDLYAQSQLATRLLKAGVIKSIRRVPVWADEPKFISWICQLEPSGDTAGGASVTDEKQAISAALSEGLERQIWFTQTDYFKEPTKATVAEINKRGLYLDPRKFVGFSDEQRNSSPELHMSETDVYLWVKAQSLLHKNEVYVPAQVVTPVINPHKNNEPIIRSQITTGLATWSDVTKARLSGMLEVIERDAYMIMWLNQLQLPRLNLPALLLVAPPSLKKIIADCEVYRLKLNVIQMITDAPTHAIAVVVEDESGVAPRFALGLSANQSLVRAVEHALLEALRGRRIYRYRIESREVWDQETPVSSIGHTERLFYWGVPDNARHLEFLTKGKIIEPPLNAVWEKDVTVEHYARLLEWCRSSGYECVSVSMGSSKINVTNFYVEKVIMPDLFPTYLQERRQFLGGEKRIRGIPERFGYIPLTKPFTERPHPFC